jgi:hypothetical protein
VSFDPIIFVPPPNFGISILASLIGCSAKGVGWISGTTGALNIFGSSAGFDTTNVFSLPNSSGFI